MKRTLAVAALASIFSTHAWGQGFSSINPFAALLKLDEEKTKCIESKLDVQLCEALFDQLDGLTSGSINGEQALDQFKEAANKRIKSPEFLNEQLLQSAAFKGLTDGTPLTLEFKNIDRDEGDSVLGLEYKFDYSFQPEALAGMDYKLTFSSEGTVTQNAEENPRNFIDSKFTFKGYQHSVFSPLTDEEGETLQRLAVDAANGDESAKREALAMLNEAVAPLYGFYYLSYGLDAGYETDQEFGAKNQKLSAYVYGQYDFWDRQSLLGAIGVTTGARLAIQSISPNVETPRARAGDDTDYYRASAEAAVSLPLGKVAGLAVDFTFNYRTYQEIGASNIVKQADLDRYHLRTYALRGPYGMYVSYVSGRLPFDLLSDQSIELGIKWYLN